MLDTHRSVRLNSVAVDSDELDLALVQLFSDAVHHHVMMREHHELQTRVSAQHLHVVANRTNLSEFNEKRKGVLP